MVEETEMCGINDTKIKKGMKQSAHCETDWIADYLHFETDLTFDCKRTKNTF